MPAIRLSFLGDPQGAVRAADVTKAAVRSVEEATVAANKQVSVAAKSVVSSYAEIGAVSRRTTAAVVEGGRAQARAHMSVAEAGLASARSLVANELKKREATAATIRALAGEAEAYGKGTEAAKIATAEKIRLERQLQATIRETSLAAAGRGRGGTLARDASRESQVARGFTTRAVGASSFGGTGFLIGAAAGVGIRDAIKAATALNAEIIRSRAIFGNSAREIVAWSKTTAHSLGLSRDDALRTADSFQVLFNNMGLGRRTATDMTRTLTELVPKLALFGRTDPAQAQQALAQGIAGRTRGLRIYGFAIDSVAIKAEALRLHLVQSKVDLGKVEEAQTRYNIALAKAAQAHRDYAANSTQVATADNAARVAHDSLAKATAGSTQQLTQAQKAQATYSLILQQSGPAQKAWADSQGSQAVQTQKLRAEIHNFVEDIGQSLLPTFRRITTGLTEWLGNSKTVESVQRNLKQAIDGVILTVKAAAVVVKTFVDLVGGWKNAMIGLFAVFAVQRFAAIGSAVIGMGRAFAITFGLIQGEAVATSVVIKAALISTGIGALVVAAGLAAVYIITHWDKVKRWIIEFGAWIKGHATALLAVPLIGPFLFAAEKAIEHWRTVKHFFEVFVAWIRVHMRLIADIANPFNEASRVVVIHWGGVRDFFARFFGWLKTAVDKMDSVLSGPFKVAAAIVLFAWKAVKAWFNDWFASWASKIGLIGKALSLLPSHLPGADKFKKWGESLVSSFTDVGSQGGKAYGKAFAAAFVKFAGPTLANVTGAAGTESGAQAASDSPQRAAAGATTAAPGRPTTKQQRIVATAKRLGPASGDVYVTGGANIQTGYDCSGYLYDVYKRNGIDIPRTSEGQWNDPNAIQVPPGEEAPGDGLYFTGSSKYPPPGHCGIYVGGGKFIEYFSSGKKAHYANLADRSDYWGARRWLKVARQQVNQPTGGLDAAARSQTPSTGGQPGTGDTTTKLVVAKPRHTHTGQGLAIKPGKLSADQEHVAKLIYQTALKLGATDAEALAMVAAAYAESNLNPAAANGGLFQIDKLGNPKTYAKFIALLNRGYDPTTAAVIAMEPEFEKVGKGMTDPYAIAAAAERPSGAAVRQAGYASPYDFYKSRSGGIFGFGTGAGYGVTSSEVRSAQQRLATVRGIRGKMAAELAEANKLIAEGFFTPETAADLRGRIAKLRALVANALKDGVVTGKEYSAIRSAWLSVANTIKAGVKAAAAAAVGLRIVRATIKAALKDGLISDAELQKISDQLQGLGGNVAKHLAALVKTITGDRQKLADAWGKVKDTILAAFDENVVQRVAKLRDFGGQALTVATARVQERRAQGTIASIETGGMTPAMGTIKATAENLIAAYKDFAKAMQGAAGGTSLSGDQAGVQAAADKLAAASDAWDSLAGDLTDAESAYRDAWQVMIDSEKTQADKALDDYQAAREQKMQLAKRVVSKDLDKVYAQLRAGKITMQQAEQSINQILAPFGLSLADLGNVLDTSDLQDSLGSLEDAVKELTRALLGLSEKGNGAGGGPRAGAGAGGSDVNVPRAGGPVPPLTVPNVAVSIDVGPLASALSAALAAALPKGAVPFAAGTGGWLKVTRPMLAALGEREPEYLNVVPQSKLGAGGGSSRETVHHYAPPSVNINVNVAGSLIGPTPEDVARQLHGPITDVIQKTARDNGLLPEMPSYFRRSWR